jgi:hypothetical protein
MRHRADAVNVAMASSTSVMRAEEYSARTTCHAVAEIMTIITPPAAAGTSRVRIRVRPGSVKPTAARTSATPRST